MVVQQSLKVSHLSVIPIRFYEAPKLKNWMCELCTFSQIQSHIQYILQQCTMAFKVVCCCNDLQWCLTQNYIQCLPLQCFTALKLLAAEMLFTFKVSFLLPILRLLLQKSLATCIYHTVLVAITFTTFEVACTCLAFWLLKSYSLNIHTVIAGCYSILRLLNL